MKLYIVGYGRSGKDHAGEYLRKTIGLDFESSSYVAARHFIFGYMCDEHDYETVDECFADRHNYRSIWYDYISNFNIPDRTKLSEVIFKDNDAYIGLRNYDELEAAKKRWHLRL